MIFHCELDYFQMDKQLKLKLMIFSHIIFMGITTTNSKIREKCGLMCDFVRVRDL